MTALVLSGDCAPVAVIKLGSSVLRAPEDLLTATAAIYSRLARGMRVVAVVSAIGSDTDDLIDIARRAGDDGTFPGDPHTRARLLASGEERSALLLSLALERAGIDGRVCSIAEAGLVTTGPPLEGEPASLDRNRLRQLLADSPVVILPGFAGMDGDGRPTLLGRGGSDLTALFVASELDAAECLLCKDVDGLYDHDPADALRQPGRFQTAHWRTALAVGGPLVQPRAVEFAARRGLSFEITNPLAQPGTRIGPLADHRHWGAQPPPLRVGVLGAGTVGGGLLAHLSRLPGLFEVTAVAVSDLNRQRAGLPDGVPVTNDGRDVLAAGCDVLLELIGGTGVAGRLVETALSSGIDVITANKALLALRGPHLTRLAERSGARLRGSAAVGGGMPALECVRAAVQRGPVRRISGVLNGTCNFVLDRIANGAAFDTAVRDAQEAGFAEADPAMDLDGIDAASKLTLLVREAWGADADVRTTGIRGMHDLPGVESTPRVRRLVAGAAVRGDGSLEARVGPELLEPSDFLAGACGVGNRLEVELQSGQVLRATGAGAGRWPTALAVLADLTEAATARSALAPASAQSARVA
jgi:homoserine dehydrogenase